MMDATIFPATDMHVDLLLEDLRENDRIEIDKEYANPRDAFARAMGKCRDPFAAFSPRGRIMCIGGVNPLTVISDVACPWLLTSNEVDYYPKIFLKRTRFFVNNWRQKHKILRNFVDAEYKQALRWAKWAGFEVSDPAPYGFTGAPFCKIEIRSE